MCIDIGHVDTNVFILSEQVCLIWKQIICLLKRRRWLRRSTTSARQETPIGIDMFGTYRSAVVDIRSGNC